MGKEKMARRFLVVGVVVLFSGCSHFGPIRGSSKGLTGRWKLKDSFQGSQILTFKKDNTYTLDLDGDGTPETLGEYHLYSWNEIMLKDLRGQIPADCKEMGIYRYTLAAGEVHFQPTADQCSSRRQAFSLIWRKI